MLTRLLRLKDAPQPADASDGVAAAVTCLLAAHMERLTAAGRSAALANGAHGKLGARQATRPA
jgi:hypothetical protein